MSIRLTSNPYVRYRKKKSIFKLENEGKERKNIIKTLEPLIDEHIKRYNFQLKWLMATI